MDNTRTYYVYVYIDPRNFEEFYYGKGKRNRKLAHVVDTNDDSETVRRIKVIKSAGRDPTIKVIASGLTEDEAFLIETTLIWKLGRTLDNDSPGHFTHKFRPHNTLHLDLKGFDYHNGIFLLNVGEAGALRSWRDCQRYGYMSAGQCKRYRKLLEEFRPGESKSWEGTIHAQQIRFRRVSRSRVIIDGRSAILAGPDGFRRRAASGLARRTHEH